MQIPGSESRQRGAVEVRLSHLDSNAESGNLKMVNPYWSHFREGCGSFGLNQRVRWCEASKRAVMRHRDRSDDCTACAADAFAISQLTTLVRSTIVPDREMCLPFSTSGSRSNVTRASEPLFPIAKLAPATGGFQNDNKTGFKGG